MPKAFLSYSRSSERSVQRIHDDLIGCGIDEVWWDDRLVGAQSWWDTILRHIRAADVVVCLIDEGMPESTAVRREYQYAIDLGKPLLPILLSDRVEISSLPIQLAGKQYVDYRPRVTDPVSGLRAAVGSLPPAPELPHPLPPEPPIPISERDYLKEKVSSTEPLEHDVQVDVLSRLRRLARSDEAAQREFAHASLKRMRNRSELLASVADDIDAAVVKPVSEQKSNNGAKIVAAVIGGLLLVSGAGYLYTTGTDHQDSGHQVTVERSENTLPGTPMNGTSASNESVNTTEQNDKRVVEAGTESQPDLDRPIAGGVADSAPVEAADKFESVSSKEDATLTLSDVDSSTADQSGMSTKETMESVDDVNSQPNNQSSTEADGSDDSLTGLATSADKTIAADTVTAAVAQSTANPPAKLDDETSTDYESADQQTLIEIEDWDSDFSIFEETSFSLCGYSQFTAATKLRTDGTVIDVRSKDRSIPDQPFRGLQVQIPSNQVFEILPGCFILLNHESTSGVSRIRVRAKGAR